MSGLPKKRIVWHEGLEYVLTASLSGEIHENFLIIKP
jgi:hypothetical protein